MKNEAQLDAPFREKEAVKIEHKHLVPFINLTKELFLPNVMTLVSQTGMGPRDFAIHLAAAFGESSNMVTWEIADFVRFLRYRLEDSVPITIVEMDHFNGEITYGRSYEINDQILYVNGGFIKTKLDTYEVNRIKVGLTPYFQGIRSKYAAHKLKNGDKKVHEFGMLWAEGLLPGISTLDQLAGADDGHPNPGIIASLFLSTLAFMFDVEWCNCVV
jgi:hypothetical protein